MANPDINEGRGFPLADEPEPPPVALAPHRLLLFKILERALRSEYGVRFRQSQGKGTGYYAGRRAAAICDAAQLMEVLYGGDYEEAKKTISEAVRAAGEAVPMQDLIENSEELAITIAEKALLVI